MTTDSPALPWRDRLARNGGWFLLPVVVPQLLVAASIPEQSRLFQELEPLGLAVLALAGVLTVWPFSMVTELEEPRGRWGLALYLAGILGALGGRVMLVLSGTLAVSAACAAGLLAALSPALLFAGVALMCRARYYLWTVGLFAGLSLVQELGRGQCLP